MTIDPSVPLPIGAIELVCLDLAGTTVADDGLVEAAFDAALDVLDVHEAAERERFGDYVRETMGTSKIDVFRAMFSDEQQAQRANTAFEAAYEEQLGSGLATPIPGAEATIAQIRASGRKVALITGFSARTRDRLLEALGWSEMADLVLSPSDVGRGRPAPDLVLGAVLRLQASAVGAVAVAGDTAADMASGRRAGAAIVAGVLTGADGPDRLEAAGATHVLDSVVDLLDVITGE